MFKLHLWLWSLYSKQTQSHIHRHALIPLSSSLWSRYRIIWIKLGLSHGWNVYPPALTQAWIWESYSPCVKSAQPASNQALHPKGNIMWHLSKPSQHVGPVAPSFILRGKQNLSCGSHLFIQSMVRLEYLYIYTCSHSENCTEEFNMQTYIVPCHFFTFSFSPFCFQIAPKHARKHARAHKHTHNTHTCTQMWCNCTQISTKDIVSLSYLLYVFLKKKSHSYWNGRTLLILNVEQVKLSCCFSCCGFQPTNSWGKTS